jgi:hypothetical protein
MLIRGVEDRFPYQIWWHEEFFPPAHHHKRQEDHMIRLDRRIKEFSSNGPGVSHTMVG